MHIMYLLFWEDALESYMVNKYLLNGVGFSSIMLSAVGELRRLDLLPGRCPLRVFHVTVGESVNARKLF